MINGDTLQQQLLAWFQIAGRDLPWRRTRDPYAILVAELMLQQTQVDRVIPKYHAFLTQFPTVAALASAATADVITAWAGLGYNRRAVNLQRTARVIQAEYGGIFPQDVVVLQSLPGIGPYTAGAIACFAFEQAVPFVDTNIRRVLQRVFFGATRQSDTILLNQARQIIPVDQGWAWNQAIMELGALICRATNPQCWQCPLREQCRDYAERQLNDETVFQEYQPSQRPLRRVAEKREAPFAGSNRYYRGRLIELLRAASDNSIVVDQIGRLLKPEYTPEDRPWLRTMIEGLVRDGLLEVDGDLVRLPR
jgi:A/G-specific adenine glycosylase